MDRCTLALVVGWLSVAMGSFAGWTWAESLLAAPQLEGFQDAKAFLPLILGALLAVAAVCLSLFVISRRRFAAGVTLLLAGIFLPAFSCIWPFAVRVVQSFEAPQKSK